MALSHRTTVAVPLGGPRDKGHPGAAGRRDRAVQTHGRRAPAPQGRATRAVVVRLDLTLASLIAGPVTAIAWHREATLSAIAVTALFTAAVTCVALIDFRTRRIPDIVTLPGIALAFVVASLAGVEALASAFLGAGLALGVTGAMYALARGQFGMGDVKLAGLGGAVLGLSAVPAYLVLASLLAAAAAVTMLARGATRDSTMAYGPYLAAAGILCCCLATPVAG